MEADPPPDGVVRQFGVPESRLVPGTLKVFLQGQELTDGVTATDDDLLAGIFTLDNPPDTGSRLLASYYFQWFTDAELTEFLSQAGGTLGYDGVEDPAIEVKYRTPVLSYACYYAYLKKAAEAAAALQASAGGFTSDTSREHPNWMNLAKMMLEQAKEELQQADTPLGTVGPVMSFVTLRTPRYTPRS